MKQSQISQMTDVLQQVNIQLKRELQRFKLYSRQILVIRINANRTPRYLTGMQTIRVHWVPIRQVQHAKIYFKIEPETFVNPLLRNAALSHSFCESSVAPMDYLNWDSE